MLNKNKIKIKTNVENILMDIFLVGGGSSGSCCKDVKKGIPITGECKYFKNILINLDADLSIEIGQGGKGVPGGFMNSNEDIFINGGTATIFNKTWIAMGGYRDEDGICTGGYGSTTPKSYKSKTSGYFDKYGEFIEEMGSGQARCYNCLGLEKTFIPLTNQIVCSKGTHYNLDLKYFEDKVDDTHPTYNYEYSMIPQSSYNFDDSQSFLKEFSFREKSIFRPGTKWEYSLVEKYSISIPEGKDALYYGGSGSSTVYSPNEEKSKGDGGLVASYVANAYPDFKNKYYRGDIGAGGQGICVLYIRRDYCD